MKYEQEKLRNIFDADSDNKLVLPNFQRDFVWSMEKQSNLLASILVGLPIGSVLIIKGNKNDFPARHLCLIDTANPKEECKFLLDGQQRLSCLKSIFDNLYSSESWKSVWDNIYGKLRNRWFLKISSLETSSEDVFGWKALKFENNLNSYDPEQILDFIVCHKVLVKGENNNDWHHPAYKIYNESKQEVTGDAQKRNQLAIEYAKRNLVPLFEIYSNNEPSSLHNLSLRKIANARRESLKAEVQDNKLSIENILGHINPNISNVNNSEELDEAWRELSSSWAKEVQTALEKLLDQEILETVLPSSEIARAASIFETINEGGTPLSNFDLIVAKTAKSGEESLAQTFKKCIAEEIHVPQSIVESGNNWKMSNMKAIKENSIVRFVTDQFLNLLSILCYQSESDKGIDDIKLEHIKQTKILKLTSEQINNNFRRAIKSIRKAFAFLQYRCGIVEVNDIGYRLMILPIAYIFSLEETNDIEEKYSINQSQVVNTSSSNQLDKETINEQNYFNPTKVWEKKKHNDKIEYWYWSSLFSGRYKEKQNERCIEDIKLLYDWVINDINNPFMDRFNSILEKLEYSDEVTLLQKEDFPPPKAIKYGLLQYVLSHNPKDFCFHSTSNRNSSMPKLKAWDIARNNENIEEHHIIPLGSATSIEESTAEIRKNNNHLLNSPLNLTYISKKANREISDLPPKIYLEKLTDITVDKHEISTHMIELLKKIKDEYDDTFYEKVIKERFQTIKRSIKKELEDLIDSD